MAGPKQTNFSIPQDADFLYGFTRYKNAQTATVVAPPGATGTFTLTTQGQTTVPIDIAATAETVQAALRALPKVTGSGCSVTGSAGGPWTITWTRRLSRAIQPPILPTTNFTPSGSISIDQVPYDLTGYTADCKMRPAPGDPTVLLAITEIANSQGQVLITPLTGNVQIFINHATTATYTFPGTAQLDLDMIAPTTNYREAWITAQVTIARTVLV